MALKYSADIVFHEWRYSCKECLRHFAGDEGFEGGQCVQGTGGLVAAERRAVELGDLVAFDDAEEGAGLMLEAAEFHIWSLRLFLFDPKARSEKPN